MFHGPPPSPAAEDPALLAPVSPPIVLRHVLRLPLQQGHEDEEVLEDEELLEDEEVFLARVGLLVVVGVSSEGPRPVFVRARVVARSSDEISCRWQSRSQCQTSRKSPTVR